MTNAEKFKLIFGVYATELWAKPEKEFLEWLNAEVPDTNVGDTISRQYAIENYQTVCRRTSCQECPLHIQVNDKLTDCELELFLHNLPSAQPNVHDRNVGEWDMFELITSTWYGKQCYFVEENGIVYSRVSCKYMSVDEAIKEFLGRIGDNG